MLEITVFSLLSLAVARLQGLPRPQDLEFLSPIIKKYWWRHLAYPRTGIEPVVYSVTSEMGRRLRPLGHAGSVKARVMFVLSK